MNNIFAGHTFDIPGLRGWLSDLSVVMVGLGTAEILFTERHAGLGIMLIVFGLILLLLSTARRKCLS